MADWTIKAGDTAPAYEDTLTYEDGTVPTLAGSTLVFIMRASTATTPVVLGGTVTITNPSAGTVRFSPVSADTATPGQYMAAWRLTFADGSTMTFPTVGYITVTVEENLTATGGEQLVSVADAKGYMNISAGDRTHDAKLARFIRAARPIVENITGPIIPAIFDEWHNGGGSTIQIRRRPSSTYGTTPILDLQSVDEYTGSQLHSLTIIDNPSLGSSYSCMIDEIGTITRRTGGGGIGCFSGAVKVTYQAGQSTIPANVYEGTLELLRVNYQTTMGVGRGRLASTDELEAGVPLGFYVPRRVAELLAPSRRHPSLA